MAFEKEDELCAEYCYETNSDLEIWCTSNNISTGYIRMSHYFTQNLDGKNGGRVGTLLEVFKIRITMLDGTF